MNPRKIELLAPAKDLTCGLEAIRHGADAVYIGAPKFGARAAAANSGEDIRTLCDYAHLYGARVYVALNTILTDDELAEAERMIWELWRAGADALIVQDMGITQLDLPPIPLHASTQTDNRTVEKVRFFEQAGFTQVVLARELTLDEIREIAAATTVPLEVFVHGALCVSYSGQCYLSEALSGRSANRGACAQYCRLPYTLVDADGTKIAGPKHLLSLKDMNRSDRLEALLDAGIGKDILSTYENGIAQPYFSVIAKNADVEQKDVFCKGWFRQKKKACPFSLNCMICRKNCFLKESQRQIIRENLY